MNSNRAYMHDCCSCANDFFILFFSLSLSSCSLIYLLLTTKEEKGGWVHVGSDLFDIIKN